MKIFISLMVVSLMMILLSSCNKTDTVQTIENELGIKFVDTTVLDPRMGEIVTGNRITSGYSAGEIKCKQFIFTTDTMKTTSISDLVEKCKYIIDRETKTIGFIQPGVSGNGSRSNQIGPWKRYDRNFETLLDWVWLSNGYRWETSEYIIRLEVFWTTIPDPDSKTTEFKEYLEKKKGLTLPKEWSVPEPLQMIYYKINK